MSFQNEYTFDGSLPPDCRCFLFQGQTVMVTDSEPEIPTCGHLERPPGRFLQRFGSFRGEPCCVAEGPQTAPDGFEYVHLRGLFGRIPDELLWLGGRAYQILEWDRTTQFCGVCGTATERDPAERAKQCPNCGFRQYPRVTPAMIVAVVREDRLLLAQSVRYRGNMHSVLAGFVEPGETLEECVHREVYEEVKVRVKNLQYYASQSWPFPHSLMVAFTADYASGEIEVDESEIRHAYWCKAGELPEIPNKMSVSRRLIDWFVDTHGGDR